MPDTTIPATTLAPSPTSDMLANPELFAHMQRVAKVFCASALIPDHLKKNNGADAFLALQIARERGENPVTVMQNIYFVSGKAGWSASYMVARANKSGTFKGPIRWRKDGAGDGLKVTAYARMADDGEEVSAEVTLAMAKAEGWTRNSKYQTMPEHMLRWRSATMLIRLYCPEVLIGMSTADELEDMRAAGQLRDVTGDGSASVAESVNAILQPATTDADAAPQEAVEGEVLPAAKSWRIADDVVGLDARLKAVLDLLDLTETRQDCDDLAAEHADLIGKAGRRKAEIDAAIRERREGLAA